MKFLSLLTILLFGLFASSQSLNKNLVAAIEQSIKEEMKYSSAPGLSICIIKDGKIAYQHSFGIANTTTNIPVTDSTVFHVASVTKIFTSIALQSALKQQNAVAPNRNMQTCINMCMCGCC